ncbi:MAG: flagellar biosynthetic protein FliR [Pseudomonadota bacterium]
MPLALDQEVFAALLVFARLGSALMVAPGFGEAYISFRVRLLFAIALSLLAMPLLGDRLPALPPDFLAMAILVIREIIVGLLIGTILRLALMAIHFAGGVIAMQSGLAAATFFDPSEGTQSALTSNYLTIAALTMMFATDMHLLLLQGLVASYAPIAPLDGHAFNDAISFLIEHSSAALLWGVRFAAPLLVVSLVFQLLMGVLNRLMPTFQVFFVAIPLQLMLSFGVIALGLGAILFGFITLLEQSIAPLASGN